MNNSARYVKNTDRRQANVPAADTLTERTTTMNINDIRIRKILQEGRLRAVVSITIDNSIAVHDIKIVQGDDRLFVAMPSRKDESGIFRDIVHPISPDARGDIETRIISAYRDYVSTQERGSL